MSIVKNQHFVPQCYLRKFGDKNEKVNVFDKSKNEIRLKQPIDNIASQRFFYDIDFKKINREMEDKVIHIPDEIKDYVLNFDKQYLEKKWFSEIVEPLLIKSINNIESTYNLVNDDKLYEIDVINDNIKSDLLFLLPIQIMRTMEFRETCVNQAPNMFLKFIEKMKNENDLGFEDLDLEYRKEVKPLVHAQLMLDDNMNKMIIESLSRHIWYVGINLTEIPLYTSDNPIVKCPHKFEKGKSYFGLASEGIEIIYPITSRLTLIMRDRDYHKHYSVFENKFLKLTRKDIIKYNLLQVEQCYRTVFSLDKEFTLAKKFCGYNKDIMDINRTRINVY